MWAPSAAVGGKVQQMSSKYFGPGETDRIDGIPIDCRYLSLGDRILASYSYSIYFSPRKKLKNNSQLRRCKLESEDITPCSELLIRRQCWKTLAVLKDRRMFQRPQNLPRLVFLMLFTLGML